MNGDFTAWVQTVLWPAAAGLFLLMGIICLFVRKWLFGASLLVVGLLLGGSWQYNRTLEEVSTFHVLLTSLQLVKDNPAQPEEAIYEVSVSALERGNWVAKLRAKDIQLTRPEQVVVVEFGKRPMTGTYIKSIRNRP